MRTAYRVLAVLVSVVTAFQIAVVAFAFFGLIHAVDDDHATLTKKSIDDATGHVGFVLHSIGADVLFVVALALLVVSFFAKVPSGVKWAAITFGLIVVQFGLAFAAYAAWPIGLLHGLNALAILVVAGVAARVGRESAQSAVPTPAG